MAPGTDPSLPALGTGKYDWRGWLRLNRHPHMIEPRSDILTNWNNKPAPGWGAASDNYGYGAVHRVQLYRGFKRDAREQRRLDHEPGRHRGSPRDRGLADHPAGARRRLGAEQARRPGRRR